MLLAVRLEERLIWKFEDLETHHQIADAADKELTTSRSRWEFVASGLEISKSDYNELPAMRESSKLAA